MAGLDPDLLLRTSAVKYARRDGAHVAYRVITGKRGGAIDVVLVLSGTASMEAFFEDAVGVRLFGGLADLGRLVVFDRCGIGLSDAPPASSDAGFAGWCCDVEAVVGAAGLDRLVVMSALMGSSAVLLYCDRHPDQVSAVVMFEPSLRFASIAASSIGRSRARSTRLHSSVRAARMNPDSATGSRERVSSVRVRRGRQSRTRCQPMMSRSGSNRLLVDWKGEFSFYVGRRIDSALTDRAMGSWRSYRPQPAWICPVMISQYSVARSTHCSVR